MVLATGSVVLVYLEVGTGVRVRLGLLVCALIVLGVRTVLLLRCGVWFVR